MRLRGLQQPLSMGSQRPTSYMVEMAEDGRPIRIRERTITGQTQAFAG